MHLLRPLLTSFYELLFPARCLGCEEQLASSRPPLLCPDCLQGKLAIPPPFCTCCGTPLPGEENHLCLICLDNPLAFTKARSSFLYQEPISTLLLQLKFSHNLTGLTSLAALAQETPALVDLNEPDLILPIPLHIQRLRERGFNQSLLLARACFPEWQEKIRFDLLKRQRSTIPQTRLSGTARRNNLHKAFCLEKPDHVQEVKGKNILLVDDVFTTGSTLHECAKVLLEAGAGEIEAFTVARSGAAGTGGRSVLRRKNTKKRINKETPPMRLSKRAGSAEDLRSHADDGKKDTTWIFAGLREVIRTRCLTVPDRMISTVGACFARYPTP